jgi:hypothetical protein
LSSRFLCSFCCACFAVFSSCFFLFASFFLLSPSAVVVVVVVSWMKTSLKSLQRYYERRRKSSIIIQCYLRRYLAQLLKHSLLIHRKATILQCLIRQFLSKKQQFLLQQQRLYRRCYRLWYHYQFKKKRYDLFCQMKVLRIKRFYFSQKHRYYQKKYRILISFYQKYLKKLRRVRFLVAHAIYFFYLRKRNKRNRVTRLMISVVFFLLLIITSFCLFVSWLSLASCFLLLPASFSYFQVYSRIFYSKEIDTNLS